MEVWDQTERLQRMLETARLPIRVQEAEEAPEQLVAGEISLYDGRYYLLPQRYPVCLSCEKDVPGGKDMLTLAAMLAENLNVTDQPAGREAIGRKLLLGEVTEREAGLLAKENRIPCTRSRVLLLRLNPVPPGKSAKPLLEDLVPMSGKDLLVGLDRHTAALVQECDSDEDDPETEEFALALTETVEEELAAQLTVAVSGQEEKAERLKAAFSQASRALELGRIYCPDRQVLMYSHMLRERFLGDLPEELKKKYYRILFNEQTADTLDDEMLKTVSVFQSLNLNVAETARQMYIHRNTLQHRLDKIQKVTGLDVRNFEDAMVFRLLAEMGKNTGHE